MVTDVQVFAFFLKWYFISHIFAQSTALSRLICTVIACMIELTLPRIFASSAKSFINAKITSGRSLINVAIANQ